MEQQSKKKTPRNWHHAHEKILKDWAEASSCYRHMHYQAYKVFKKLNMRFTLPIIVISTVTGTANFAQSTFPVPWQQYVPSVIGALNLFAAIMTTVLQFLKITELMESHRVSYVNYGKLARNVKLELTLPVHERTQHGATMVEVSGNEYSRLIEQSPPIPGAILRAFKEEFKEYSIASKECFNMPEIMGIKAITPYDGVKERVLLNTAVDELKKRIGERPKPVPISFTAAKDAVLEQLRRRRGGDSTPMGSETSSVQQVEITVEDPVIDENDPRFIPSHALGVERLARLFNSGNFDDQVQKH